MSYTQEDYLKSKIKKYKKGLIIGFIFLGIALVISVIGMTLFTILERGSTEESPSWVWIPPIAIVACLLIPTTVFTAIYGKKFSNAKEEYNKSRMEQTEQLISEEKAQPRPYQKYSSEEKVVSIPKEDILIFVSYATIDAPTFKIAEIAEKLTAFSEIKDVLYWQEHMKENIVDYMNRNLGKCHAMLLFCSPNAIESIPVKKEWTAAESMNKPIIPVFTSTRYVPPILSSRLGVQFDPFDMQKNIDDIHNIIMKKSS